MSHENGSDGMSRPWFDWSGHYLDDVCPDVAARFRRGEITWEESVVEAIRRFEQLVGTWLASEDKALREEVLQELLLRLHVRGSILYSRHKAALGYTEKFARNIARERRRKHWREVAMNPELANQQIDSCRTALDVAAANELVAIIRDLVRHLSAKQQWALVQAHPLLKHEGNGNGCPSSNKYVNLCRALKAMRRLLDNECE